MSTKTIDKLTKHFDKYFGQTDSKVLHPASMEPHVDALIYPPNATYPFWKMVSMGASDYAMPAPKTALGNRNEYMLFIAPEEDLTDKEVAVWYFNMLLNVALYPYFEKEFFTYGHSIEFPPQAGIVGAYLEMPQAINDVGILRCNLGWGKTAVCLQAVLLNDANLQRLLEIGPEQFSYSLYPYDGSAPVLSKRHK